MSEPLAERLSRFTPDSTGLDRDALLFAAGRASARPNRRWMAIAGVLAVSQLLTLMALWPRTPSAPINPPIVAVQPFEPVVPPTPHDPSELWVLTERLLASEGNSFPPADERPMIEPQPPLRAFGTPPAKYLN
ncbi:MAG TPA: hypothetical protein VN688_11545 [Gemmataceae bacterium]|nr:hypothetical protein [Gemmataceae bacterium]